MHVTRPNILPSMILLSCLLLLTSSIGAQVFTLGGRYPTGPSGQEMIAADFDGDGFLDLAISQTDADLVYIHLNDGTGDFSAFHTVVAARDGGLHAADFNNDGFSDLLLYDGGWLYDTWGTTVYLNNGDATFSLVFQDTVGSSGSGMCTADFDGDGNADIATHSSYEPKGIYIFFGNGNGAFAEPVLIQPEEYNFTKLITGDVDNDGDADIIYYGAAVNCILNDGSGTFGEPIPTGSAFGELADINGDQYPDLVGRGIYGCSYYPQYMIGNGDGTFQAPRAAWITAGRLAGINLEVADFNDDGFGDIAMYGSDGDSITVGLNDGRMSFHNFEEIRFVDTAGRLMEQGDFDGDGDIDLAAIGFDHTLTIALSLGVQHSSRMLVPGDIPTIQQAVDLAWNLDTVIVEPGTYTENIDFGGKNLVLMSSEYSDKGSAGGVSELISLSLTTILDGGGAGRVLTFDDFEDDRSVVAGFTIQNGNAGMGGGIYCYDTAAPTIVYNIIRDNYATAAGGGIFLHNGATTVANNLIVGNSSGNWGGGIYAGSAIIMNNTVYGNTAEGGGGGLYFNYGDPVICNNILWGNSSTVNGQQVDYLTNSPSMSYSVVEGGWTGEGNMDTDPLFIDPVSGDFNLMAGSPCIDAGDPTGPLDPDGTTADIGAYYYPSPTDVGNEPGGADLPTAFELAQNWPNPFNPATTIEYSIPERAHVSITVFNVLGRRTRLLVDREQPAGNHRVIWDGKDEAGRAVASGVYLYRLSAGVYTETKKMVLLK